MEKDSPSRRFFCPLASQADRSGQTVCLPPGEAHHAMHVLRLAVGQEVELFDGCGRSATGTIVRAKKGQVDVAVGQVREAWQRLRPLVHVAFAVPKGNRLDWLLEKATELGAASLQPVVFERSVAGGSELSENKRQRWLGQCVSAAKQCGLNFLPEIRPAAGLRQAVASAGGCRVIFGDLCEQARTIGEALKGSDPQQDVCIFVGPEGGLTDPEKQILAAAGAVPVRLGETTLRIETAVIAMLAAVRAASESSCR